MSHRISVEQAEQLKTWGRAMGASHGKTLTEDIIKTIYAPMLCRFECESCGASGHYKMGDPYELCPACNEPISS